MEASEKQVVIYNTWENEECNLLVQAVAGSGKTTTLLELLRLCKHRTLFLAFNKSIQTEIQSQIEARGLAQGKAMTLHSLGLKAIRAKHKIKINNYKGYDIVKQLQSNVRAFGNARWEDKLKMSYTLTDMNDVSRMYLTDNLDEIRLYMVQMDKNIFDIRVFDGTSMLDTLWPEFIAIRNESYNKKVVEIDFHDMIYLPILKKLEIPVHPYYLMIDEAQDLNLAQHELIDILINQGTIHKWVAVGDKYQSIYGFSGAYASSFKRFAEKDNVKELPLDICYRCPIDIVAKANEVYPIMEPFKTYTGIVQNISHFDYIKDNSMVICRNFLPLFELYFNLLASGKKVNLKGEDIIGIITKFMTPYKYKTIEQAKKKMLSEYNKLANNAQKSDSNRFKFYTFKENFDTFKTIADNLCSDSETVQDLLTKIKNIFDKDDGSTITLCTIHKAKGLEADIVYILNEHLIPSKYARSEQQLIQEENLRYVARTRAKEELYFLDI